MKKYSYQIYYDLTSFMKNYSKEIRFYSTNERLQIGEILKIQFIRGCLVFLKVNKITRYVNCDEGEITDKETDDFYLDAECEVIRVVPMGGKSNA